MSSWETGFDWWLLAVWGGLAAIFFLVLLKVPAPYGRFTRGGWGATISSRAGWLLMEFPAVAVFLVLFLVGRNRSPVCLAFFGLWMTHYVYRLVIFPLRLRSTGRSTFFTVFCAMSFQTINSYLQARYLFTLTPPRGVAWLGDWRFLLGAAMFLGGFVTVVHSDNALRRLRQPGDGQYYIPRGGLFRWVSCPNYLGEIVEWTGWAVLTWSFPGLAFAAWVVANLLPRALAYHRWYHERFPDYPAARKAILPGIL